jgi:hypothetical protein
MLTPLNGRKQDEVIFPRDALAATLTKLTNTARAYGLHWSLPVRRLAAFAYLLEDACLDVRVLGSISDELDELYRLVPPDGTEASEHLGMLCEVCHDTLGMAWASVLVGEKES